jgi:hypothetical protein
MLTLVLMTVLMAGAVHHARETRSDIERSLCVVMILLGIVVLVATYMQWLLE